MNSATTQTDKETQTITDDFIKSEYALLNQWAMHGQNTANQVFNFYVSLLTAALGGVVVITQLSPVGRLPIMVIVSGSAFLLVIVGVVFFDALVTQYIRNAYYHAGILSIQNHYQKYPEVSHTIQEHPPFSIEADAEDSRSIVGRYFPFVKYILPVGIQQIFISMVNSLLIGVVIIGTVNVIGQTKINLIQTVIATLTGVGASFLIHNLFARLALQRHINRIKMISTSRMAIAQLDEKPKAIQRVFKKKP